MVEHEKGLLPIITFDAKSTWDDVLRVASPHLNEEGMRRLQQALQGRAQYVVVERHYIDKDYRDTFANYHSKKFSTPDSRCVRLHFFDVPVDHDSVRDAHKVQPHYLSVTRSLGHSVTRSLGHSVTRSSGQPGLTVLGAPC